METMPPAAVRPIALRGTSPADPRRARPGAGGQTIASATSLGLRHYPGSYPKWWYCQTTWPAALYPTQTFLCE